MFNRTLRLNALIDRQSGVRKLNNTLRQQCQAGASCRGLFDISASQDQQAAAVAAQEGVQTGFLEDGTFTRLRELSMVYTMPTAWANRLRASVWRVALTGRNVAVWSRYRGVDPESQLDNSDARGAEEYFSTPPQTRHVPHELRFLKAAGVCRRKT